MLKVVEGDTIKIDYEGKSATVRLIGVIRLRGCIRIITLSSLAKRRLHLQRTFSLESQFICVLTMKHVSGQLLATSSYAVESEVSM